MRKHSLNGDWTLYYFEQGSLPIKTPGDLAAQNAPHVSATVPGNVEIDLMRAGVLPDVFFGDNVHLLRQYEGHEYWYARSFIAPAAGKRTTLRFEGVDCLAEYFLNGVSFAKSQNALIEHEFDVTALLREDENTLCVRLASPIEHAMEQSYAPSMSALPSNWESLHVRKAPSSYGWDIMPRILASGLWRSVSLVEYDEIEILDAYLYTAGLRKNGAGGFDASLGLYFSASLGRAHFGSAKLRLKAACGGHVFSHEQTMRFSSGLSKFEVRDILPWWPRGYGEANLYDITLELVLPDGRVVATHCWRAGIRTVELERTDITSIENPGKFGFIVNGQRVFFKGSNWVPLDALHSRDAARYEAALDLLIETNSNILRCWGGNVYEDHAFFDLCDERGIMVWQDFSFACASYPLDDAFLESARIEAESVVKKLRNHPSILLWSGDNECDAFIFFRGMDPKDNILTRETLPNAVRKQDPYRPYLPSSPYLAPALIDKDDRELNLLPEHHLWGPRDYFKDFFYRSNRSHFISEIGYHGCPNVSSLKRFLSQDSLWPWQNNSQWRTHCTEPVPEGAEYAYRVQLMDDQIRELFGRPMDTLEDFALASQISQAEAKKFFIEMMRIGKWERTGIIWWNLIDGWPQLSDAVVDYYFAKKLAFHYIVRSQQDFCLLLGEIANWHLPLVACNDTPQTQSGAFRVYDAETGETLLSGDYSVPAHSNAPLGRIRALHSEKRLLFLEWRGPLAGANHYVLGSPPLDFDRYKAWLPLIAKLRGDFDAGEVGG